MKPRALHVCVLSALLACTASADILWNLSFGDVLNGTGIGFDDPTAGDERQATVNSVLQYINSEIQANGTVDLEFTNSQNDASGFLGAAGPFYNVGPNGFANGFVFDHANTGVDPNPTVPDAQVTFDFGYNWNSGIGAPAGDEFDIYSVLLHELTHAMGFLSLVSAAGTSAINGGNPGVFSVYDSHLTLGDGTPLFAPGGQFSGSSDDLISDDVFFDGAAARAANGGQPLPIFSPGGFQQGSSISHFDPLLPGVMNPSIAPGQSKRVWTAADLGVLVDIGWLQASTAPEPSSLLLGLLLIGVVGLRKVGQRVRPKIA